MDETQEHAASSQPPAAAGDDPDQTRPGRLLRGRVSPTVYWSCLTGLSLILLGQLGIKLACATVGAVVIAVCVLFPPAAMAAAVAWYFSGSAKTAALAFTVAMVAMSVAAILFLPFLLG